MPLQILDRVDPTNTNVYVGNLAPHLTGEGLGADALHCCGYEALYMH